MKLFISKLFNSENKQSVTNAVEDDDPYRVDAEVHKPIDPSNLARAASFEYPHHAVSARNATGVKFR